MNPSRGPAREMYISISLTQIVSSRNLESNRSSEGLWSSLQNRCSGGHNSHICGNQSILGLECTIGYRAGGADHEERSYIKSIISKNLDFYAFDAMPSCDVYVDFDVMFALYDKHMLSEGV